jgi:hypothetical protein
MVVLSADRLLDSWTPDTPDIPLGRGMSVRSEGVFSDIGSGHMSGNVFKDLRCHVRRMSGEMSG